MNPLHIVAIGAHPDDIELSMAGLLITAGRAGHRVTWVVMTDGAAGGGGRDPELAARRATEAAAGAACAGSELVAMGFADGQLSWNTEAPAALAERLAGLAPDLIVTHPLNDYHPDHRAVARMVGECAPLGVPILRAETLLGLHFVPEILFDITAVFDDKLAALAKHESQATLAMPEAVGVWNRFRGLQSAARRFRRAEGYAVAHRLGCDFDALLKRLGGNYLLL